MKTKLCTKCHKNRGIILFDKDSTKKDGYYSNCKDCRRFLKGSKKRIPREKYNRKGEKIRWCGRCKKYKEKIKFGSNKFTKDGLHFQCKSCAVKDANTENARKGRAGRRQLNRTRILLYYSNNNPQCSCCGEKEDKFLCLDHINGGGHQHRKNIKNRIYEWIIKNDFPKGFQILCHNCNMAKGFYGECPHKINI